MSFYVTSGAFEEHVDQVVSNGGAAKAARVLDYDAYVIFLFCQTGACADVLTYPA